METLDRIKILTEELSLNTIKFYENNNKSAGTRARQNAQELKNLLQTLRKEISEKKNVEVVK